MTHAHTKYIIFVDLRLLQVTHSKPFAAPAHSTQVTHMIMLLLLNDDDADADAISLTQVLYVVFSDGTASSLSYPPSTDR